MKSEMEEGDGSRKKRRRRSSEYLTRAKRALRGEYEGTLESWTIEATATIYRFASLCLFC